MKYIFFISLPLYLLDRITKYWVLHSIDPDNPRRIIPNSFMILVYLIRSSGDKRCGHGHGDGPVSFDPMPRIDVEVCEARRGE